MLPRTFLLTIDRLSYGTAGVGRFDGKVIFVPGTVPGDQVEVALEAEKKTYAVGRVITLHRSSPSRRQPPCPYVSQCGGCPWQQVTYVEQLQAKEEAVREHMRRIGGFVDPPVLPILSSPQEWHYRHRIRLHAHANARLGFTQARSHELVEIETCLIAEPEIAAQLQGAREWLTSLRTTVCQIELISRTSSGGIVLLGESDGPFQNADEETCANFLATHANVSGLVLTGQQWRRMWGDPTISFALGVDGLTVQVSPGIFTQVNLAGNHVLLSTLLSLGNFHNSQRVIELYCGAGNFSLPLARCVRELVGIEQDRRAVADARTNAARMNITNARFIHASARAGAADLLRHGVRGDVVVLDPPRAGAAEVIDMLPRFGAQSIIYVSCDPVTLARDLRRLSVHGYRLHVLQPLDLFPHTYHVETIALADLTC
jgi:23S rRNA (uracil1939-C5)-methyltransferase